MKITVYTDGAYSSKTNVGGWAIVIKQNNTPEENYNSYGDWSFETTNNRMELLAVIKGLSALKEPCFVDLYSDSQYLVSAFIEKWIESWQKSNWKNSGKKEVKNVDLWKKLIDLSLIHKINFIKVKGHSDNEYNNKCDRIAVDEYNKI